MKTEKLTTNQSFGSRKIYTAIIGQYKTNPKRLAPVDAIITKLSKSDLKQLKKDSELWENSQEFDTAITWLRNKQPKFLKQIATEESYFALETPEKNGKRKIRAFLVSLFDIKSKKTRIISIATNNSQNFKRKIKGAGSCLLYALLKKSKHQKSKEISLVAFNSEREFYKKHDFNKRYTCEFFLSKEKFADKIKTLQEKYSIQRPTPNNPKK